MTFKCPCIVLPCLLLAACATNPPAPVGDIPEIDGLGRNLLVREEADSWPHLVEKLHPDFTWNGCDLLWIATDADGKLNSVIMDEAHVLKEPGRPAKWVLLDVVSAEHFEYDWLYGEIGGTNLRGNAKPQTTSPQPESDAELYGEYAFIRGANPDAGTVYEVGWQRLMANGTCLCEGSRRIYLFEDLAHHWHFVGEGPEVGQGKEGGNEMQGTDLDYISVEWTNDHSAVPLKIHIVMKNLKYEWATEEQTDFVPRPDYVTYTDYTLSAPPNPPEPDSAPYLITKPGDTFDKILHYVARWEPESDDRALPFWRFELPQLNPGLPQGDIPAGTHIKLLRYGDLIDRIGKFSEKQATAKQ